MTEKHELLKNFISKITHPARAELAEYIIAQKLLEEVVDSIDDSSSDGIVIDSEELQVAIDVFKGLIPQASPLALIAAFCDPSATTELLDAEAIQKFSISLPDLYALCKTPEAQALTPTEIFYELYHGAGNASALVSEWFEDFNAFRSSSAPIADLDPDYGDPSDLDSSGLVN